MANLEYALTENPTIYVSLIQQFWNTATARTLDNREMEITATIDGKGPVVQGEGSTVPIESHHTPTSAPSTSQPPSSSSSRRTTRQEFMVPQPRSPTQTNVADETASTGVDVRHGGATTTVTSLDAAHGNGIFDKTPTMPHDSPLPRVYTLISDEGRMQHNELMDLVTKFTTEPVSTAGASVSTAGASSAKDKGKAIMEEAETIQTKTKLQLEQERLGYEEALRLLRIHV
ncbi:hypothetical protein Tco_0650278 [Tanacetum coccineum]